jgi:CRISPR/Cas system-associated exonuclease Cas4 (RecB family)
MLRAAFDASPAHEKLRFPGPAARLGNVCHAILEAAGNGAFVHLWPEGWEEAFDSMWQERIAEQERMAQRSPLEQRFGPSSSWPKYELKRALLRVKAKRLTRLRAESVSNRKECWSQVHASERQYSGFGGWLRGRADHVVREHAHVVIEDYKSGAIANPEGGEGPEIKANYRRQLLLYAALHWDETGEWPDQARVIPLRGKVVTITIDPEEALAVVHETRALLDRYSTAVQAGMVSVLLGRPAQSNCAFCPYKAVCAPFWESVREDWDVYGVFAEGTVTGVDHLKNIGTVLGTEVLRGNVPRGFYHLSGLPDLHLFGASTVTAGDVVRMLAGQRETEGTPSNLVPSKYSQVWKMQGDGASWLLVHPDATLRET